MVQIGKYLIKVKENGIVEVHNNDGEGGDFHTSELEKAIEKFFTDNF